MTQLHSDPHPLKFLKGAEQCVVIDVVCLFVAIAKDMFLFIFLYLPVVEKLQAIPCALSECKYLHQGVHTLTVHRVIHVTNGDQ